MSRYETRINPEVLPNEALLPSQRALLDLETGLPKPTNLLFLTQYKDELISLIKNGLVPATEAAFEKDKGITSYRLSQLNFLKYSMEELSDEQSSAHANIFVTDNYERHISTLTTHYPSYTSELEVYTPEGLVAEPSEDFKQKIAILGLRRYGVSKDFVFYTNNLSIQTPSWEYLNEGNVSDLFPAREHDPYWFRADSAHFPNEDVAFAAVQSLTKIVNLASKSKQERISQ